MQQPVILPGQEEQGTDQRKFGELFHSLINKYPFYN